MKQRFQAEAHLPKGSADPVYRIIDTEDADLVIAIVDPHNSAFEDPKEVAEHMAKLLSLSPGPLA